jgi:hypothetical protein
MRGALGKMDATICCQMMRRPVDLELWCRVSAGTEVQRGTYGHQAERRGTDQPTCRLQMDRRNGRQSNSEQTDEKHATGRRGAPASLAQPGNDNARYPSDLSRQDNPENQRFRNVWHGLLPDSLPGCRIVADPMAALEHQFAKLIQQQLRCHEPAKAAFPRNPMNIADFLPSWQLAIRDDLAAGFEVLTNLVKD